MVSLVMIGVLVLKKGGGTDRHTYIHKDRQTETDRQTDIYIYIYIYRLS